MLLTVTNTTPPATDLAWLLHKHPDRCQTFGLPFGQARVFYPEASDDRCVAALSVDMDPVGLVRRDAATSAMPLLPYVNDRPYVGSSFLSVAIAQVFGSALAGRCKARQDLVSAKLTLEAAIPVVACNGGQTLIKRLFGPLGYDVEVADDLADDEPSDWRPSHLMSVRLRQRISLHWLLTHLYVLVPVLDDDKHYWVGDDEVNKLVRHGQGWLPGHPERELIARRYLKHQTRLARQALLSLSEESGSDPEAELARQGQEEEGTERRIGLQELRAAAVVEKLKSVGAKRVVDLGCGEGKFVARLLRERCFDQVMGVDVSMRALEIASKRIGFEDMEAPQRQRVDLVQGSALYRDDRWRGWDALVVMEVIEHIDPCRICAFTRVVFGEARPATVVLTTPNAAYNVRFGLAPGKWRHGDHRFEWTRSELEAWATATATRHGYTVEILPIGPEGPEGPPTWMAIFRKDAEHQP